MATVVEGDQKASFSIATTPRCREGTSPFLGLFPFTLDTFLILLSVKQGGIKYHFKSLWYDATWDGTPRSPGSLANTLPTRPMTRLVYQCKFAYTIYLSIYLSISVWYIYLSIYLSASTNSYRFNALLKCLFSSLNLIQLFLSVHLFYCAFIFRFFPIALVQI